MLKLLKVLLKLTGIIKEADERRRAGKSWYKSETIWTNIILVSAFASQSYLGFELSATDQVNILATVNVALRMVTKEGLKWGK